MRLSTQLCMEMLLGRRGSGFRMPWSWRKPPLWRSGVFGVWKVRLIGSYLPVFVYRNGPLSTILKVGQEPTLDILKMAVVRTNEPQTTHVEPPSTVIKEGSFTEAQTKDEVHDEELDKIRNLSGRIWGQSNAYVPKFSKEGYLLSQTTSKYCETSRGNMDRITCGYHGR